MQNPQLKESKAPLVEEEALNAQLCTPTTHTCVNARPWGPESPELWGRWFEKHTGRGQGLRQCLPVAVCFFVQKSITISRSLDQSVRGGNLGRAHRCSFTQNHLVDLKARQKILLLERQYWSGAAHVCSGAPVLGTWPHSQRSWLNDPKRQLGGGGDASFLHSPHLSGPESQPSLAQWVSGGECKGNLNTVSSSLPNLPTLAHPCIQLVCDCLSFLRHWRIYKMLPFNASWVLGKKDARTMTSLLTNKLEQERLGRCLSKGEGIWQPWSKGPRAVGKSLASPFQQPSQSGGLTGVMGTVGRRVDLAFPFPPVSLSSPSVPVWPVPSVQASFWGSVLF